MTIISKENLLRMLPGLLESDGNLSISLEKERNSKFGLKPKLRFTIDFKSGSNLILLKELQSYFGGEVNSSTKRDTYRVKDIINLTRKVKHPLTGNETTLIQFCTENLVGTKRNDGFLFRETLNFLFKNPTKKGPGGGNSINTFAFFVAVMYKINTKGEIRNKPQSEWIQHFSAFDKEFAKKVNIYDNELNQKLSVFNQNFANNLSFSIHTKSLDPYYVTGLTQGDGSLSVGFDTKEIRIKLSFTITLLKETGNIELAEKLKSFFGVGSYRTTIESSNTLVYYAYSLKDILVIINHFKSYPLVAGTKRASQFEVMFEVVEIIKKDEHLTALGITKLINMSYDLYDEGQRRLTSKDDLIRIFTEKYNKSSNKKK